MLVRSLGVILFVSLSGWALGQKKITAYKTFGGVVYELNDSVSISPKQVSMLLQNNQMLTMSSNSPEARTASQLAWASRVVC